MRVISGASATQRNDHYFHHYLNTATTINCIESQVNRHSVEIVTPLTKDGIISVSLTHKQTMR